MADQTPSRQVWVEEGFIPYCINCERAQNIPAAFVKSARWDTIDGDLGHYARSTLLVEGEENPWIPVEFNSARFCWVEIHWEMNGPGLGNWVAHQPARQELGLDITEANFHIATTSNDAPQNCATEPREVPQIPDTTPSRPPSPNTCTTSPVSVFHILESLYIVPRAITPEPVTTISQLAAALNIQDN